MKKKVDERSYENVERIIENDDVDGLREFLTTGVSIDFVFPSVSQNRPFMLQASPPLISFAAFYKSKNCVEYIINNGATMFIDDKQGVLSCFCL